MREKRQVLAVTVLSVVAAALMAPAAAVAGTLDQQQVNVSGGDSYVDSAQSLGQTFTAGLTGRLDQVDLSLRVINAPTLSMTVEIRNVTAAQPGSTVLAAKTVMPSLITGTFAFVPITFPTPAAVAAGAHYAIVAYSANPPGKEFSWARTTSDVYAGGDGLYAASSPPSGPWLDVGAAGAADLAFKTYVGPPAPPAPAAPQPTGQRAGALIKCKKRHSKQARRKCRKKAKLLPV